MDDYNVWADVLSTFRSLNDWVKALTILSLTGPFNLTALALVLRRKRSHHPPQGPARPELEGR